MDKVMKLDWDVLEEEAERMGLGVGRNWMSVVRKTALSGHGKVRVVEEKGDYAMVQADHPMGGVMGPVKVPVRALTARGGMRMENKRQARKLLRMARQVLGMSVNRHNIEEALRDDGVNVLSIVKYGMNLIVELLDGRVARQAFEVLRSEGYPVDWVPGSHTQLSVPAR